MLPPELAQAFGPEKDEQASSSSPKKKPAKLSISELEKLMWEAVEKLDFERAAVIRDAIAEMKAEMKK